MNPIFGKMISGAVALNVAMALFAVAKSWKTMPVIASLGLFCVAILGLIVLAREHSRKKTAGRIDSAETGTTRLEYAMALCVGLSTAIAIYAFATGNHLI